MTSRLTKTAEELATKQDRIEAESLIFQAEVQRNTEKAKHELESIRDEIDNSVEDCLVRIKQEKSKVELLMGTEIKVVEERAQRFTNDLSTTQRSLEDLVS